MLSLRSAPDRDRLLLERLIGCLTCNDWAYRQKKMPRSGGVSAGQPYAG